MVWILMEEAEVLLPLINVLPQFFVNHEYYDLEQ